LGLDLTSIASAEQFVPRFKATELRLDIFIENVTRPLPRTKDGWETEIQVNAISTFYLAIEMLPFLRKSSDSRLTNRFE
ncbi:hypothetical protein V1527DRAFT_405052, partial [Lipomyces starkeyi]